MLDDFDDAFYFVSDLLEEVLHTARIVARFLIFASVPLWVIPYAIYKAKKEIEEDGL